MKMLMESALSQKAELRQLNTNYRKDLSDKGKKDFVAVFGLLLLFIKVFCQSVIFQPDIVYYYVTATVPGWIFKDIWIIFAAKLAFRRVVIHMRGGHFRFNFDAAANWQKALIRSACRCCCAGFVQGEQLRNQFEMVMPAKKIHVVYNMIDTSKYKPVDVMSYQPQRFLFLGSLSFAKGYCDLLEVIPQIVKLFPACQFVFAGYIIPKERNVFLNQLTGQKLNIKSGKTCYQECIEGKFEENYSYLGPIDEIQKIDELKKCSAVVLPSYSEGFSMSVLEALSMGKPVICTPVGALGEIVHDKQNGYLIPPGDQQALAHALKNVLEETPETTAMRQNNHLYVCNNFATEVIGKRIYELFAEIVREKSDN